MHMKHFHQTGDHIQCEQTDERIHSGPKNP